MGQKSKTNVVFEVRLSVTKLFHDRVKGEVKDADFGKMISEKTNGAAKLINETWEYTNYFLHDHISIKYEVEIDLYHIVKNNYNKMVANLAKLMGDKRRRMVAETIRAEIEHSFRNSTDYSVFNYAAVKFLGVNIV
jgi:hypothetical protein